MVPVQLLIVLAGGFYSYNGFVSRFEFITTSLKLNLLVVVLADTGLIPRWFVLGVIFSNLKKSFCGMNCFASTRLKGN
jgi:hypothetical protein